MMLNVDGRLARRGSLVVLAVVGAMCAGGASSAMAADITGTADAPVFTAVFGNANNLTVTQTGADGVRFHDATETITVDEAAIPGCVNDTVTVGDVTCTAPSGTLKSIVLNLDDGNDQTTLTGVTVPTTQNGGDDNDSLDGGDGGDQLNGENGDDHLNGGAGDDNLTGGAGADDVHGGDGFDQANQTTNPADQTLTLNDLADDGDATEGDNIHSDVEDAITYLGNDTIVGSTEDNLLNGDEGNDTITGGGGADGLVGAGGDDVIHANDGIVDTIACGPGNDEVFADEDDFIIDQPDADPTLDERCETVHRLTPPPSDGTTPGTTIPGTTTTPGTTTPGTTGSGNKPAAAPVAPISLSEVVTPKRDRKRPYKFNVKGVLVLPAGVTKAQGCASGTVKVTGKRGRKNAFAPKTVKIKKDCTYSVTVTVTRKGTVKFTARFSGNSVLKAKSSPTRTARAG